MRKINSVWMIRARECLLGSDVKSDKDRVRVSGAKRACGRRDVRVGGGAVAQEKRVGKPEVKTALLDLGGWRVSN